MEHGNKLEHEFEIHVHVSKFVLERLFRDNVLYKMPKIITSVIRSSKKQTDGK